MAEKMLRPIRIVHPGQFNAGTQQTPGSQREAAIAPEIGISSQLWGGTFVTEPSSHTGIHHHGKQDTIVYVLAGECIIRWGEHGESQATAAAGDFVHVPAWLPHMESNPSSTEPFSCVVVRSTPDPIVVNLPDDYWTAKQDATA